MAGQLSANDRDKARLEWHQRKLSCRRHTPESLNVMVVGRRGVGKSTLLQTICDSFYSLHIESLTEGDRAMFPSASYKETTTIGEEVLDPFCVFDTLSGTNVIRRCKVRIRELLDSQPITIEFVDTPGIDGTDEQKAAATINEICGEVERRLQATLDEEQRTQRSKSSFASAHIHAIIYILPPPVYHSADTDSHSHRLEKVANIVTELDLRAIRRFSQYANVIPAIGKCDTIEFSDRNILKDGSFYRVLRDLLVPDRIFDFSDTPNTPYKEPYEEVRAFRRAFLRKLPFHVCGSKHVDEWQNMRLPEYLCSSESRISIADWRVLNSKHNRLSSSSEMITKGIFRDHRRTGNAPGSAEPSLPAATSQRLRELKTQELLFASMTSSMQSLPTRSDSIQIKRLHQRREISLIREFAWGTLQINNPDHCDVTTLLDVLFVSFRKSLEYWTDETHYEKYRMQRIASDPNYADKHGVMTRYLEQEKTRFTMPVSTHREQPSASQVYNRHSDGNTGHSYGKRYSHSKNPQRRLTTGGIAFGNGNDISIVSNAATAGGASSSMVLALPRELGTRTNSDSTTDDFRANNRNRSRNSEAKGGIVFGDRSGSMSNVPEFKFEFPLKQHVGHLASPPDTAFTVATSATAATPVSHTPNAHAAYAHDEPGTSNQPAGSHPHRVSAATTLTTITTSQFKSPSTSSSMPQRQKSLDNSTGSSVRRGIQMLFSAGGSSKAKTTANSTDTDGRNIDRRGRRFTFNTATESAHA
ncbi:hypothetical protein LPJ81_002646 [Coemansia sp. IMI 209127]|nr:hypothetical protein LPJ81_002646 [Coemansia sp. IMI 209127]